MLSFLFPRLTPSEPRGSALFAAVVRAARDEGWYRHSGVPDTMDGRFAVLATVAALVIVRLERGGDEGQAAAVALTERFVESMEHEHRQLGFGDPTLGKIVRRLTGRLASRTEQFRAAVDSDGQWEDAAESSLKIEEGAHVSDAAARLAALWDVLAQCEDGPVARGEWK